MHSDGLFPIQYGKRGSKFIFNYLGEGKRFFQQNIDFSYFAPDLMDKMRAEDPNDRPTIKEVLEDPYFWTAEKLMSFLTKIHSKNDGKTSDFIKFKEALNKKKDIIFGTNVANWTSKIDAELLKNINDRRPSSYPLSSVLDLVLSIRNKVIIIIIIINII